MKKYKIAYLTPEAVPFAKTGGLADVSGALPIEISRQGHDIRLFMPLYRAIDRSRFDMKKTGQSVEVEIDNWEYCAELLELADDHLKYYFLENEFLYDREGMYIDPQTGMDYKDNADRFIFYCRAVLNSFKKLNWRPDIIHAHDWQAALAITYLKTVYQDDPFFGGIRTIFTIHNMGYQGIFPIGAAPKLGLDKAYFAPLAVLEFWGKLNFMKSAIMLTDKITTVSPTYAEEIAGSEEYGNGLEGVLRDRQNDLSGILNGVDYKIWSPQKDKMIPHNYILQNLSGKKQNKIELLNKCQLPLRTERPLLGIISRLDPQKGFDLIEEIIDDIMSLDLQMVLLGTGDKKYHLLFEEIERKYPDKFKVFLAFDNQLAHLIEAGSDMFLMPSRYEPCGLNQLYSLKYGTVPIVRNTGGLADTVIDWNDDAQKGTGFVFEDYDAGELLTAIKRAVALYNRRRTWYKIVKQGMAQDFSWTASAEKYCRLFETLVD